MPPVSEAQRKAMWAAAEGHSTLGIPQAVGKEFVSADSDGDAENRKLSVDGHGFHEYKIMEDIRYGRLPSPQKYGNVHLFDIRVTGTGMAERASGEIAHKSPADYLTNEFLARCNGLPVLWEHPDAKLLDTNSFRNQIIGTSSLPYVKGDDVWTIARIYDDEAAMLMTQNQLSTSPAVTISKSAIKNGQVLIEGNPIFIDHIAVCSAGVWDKGAPDGVRVDLVSEENTMDDSSIPSVESTLLAKILERLDSLDARVDAKHDMPHNKMDSDKEEMDCADSMEDKADESLSSEEKKEVKEECKEEIEGAHHEVDSKADSKEEEEEEKDKADSKEEEEVKDDSARADSMKIEALELELSRLKETVKERSIDDREAMAKAQSRADSVAMALGETAGIAPVMGESVFAFRKRLASRFAKFSSRFKDVDVASIKDTALFSPVEEAIYADSLEYAKAPPVAEGTVHMVEARDDAGRMIRTPTANSDPRAWMDMFSNGARFRGNIRV